MPRLLRFVASAALLVSVATLLSRLVGFGRLLVFSPSVGAGAIGTAYQSANQVPNILYEVVAGGALAGAVVPLLAGPLSRADKGTASRIASALLTWSVSLTLPLAVLIVIFREQIAGIVLDHETEVAYGAGFLLMFAPQLVLYAIGGVLTGVLQAHRRFLWPAFMPLVSSLIVIGVYVGYARLRGPEVATEDPAALALLGWGTTAGVVALALPLALPTLRTGLRIRLTWRFPDGVGARAVRLAAAGMTVLLAQQAATLMIMVVSNNVGGTGVFVVFSYIQAVYLLPYAVLAVPVATVAFPRLSELAAAARTPSAEPHESADRGPGDVDAAIARTSRLVLALGFAGAALLTAAATPLEIFFSTRDAASGDSPRALRSARRHRPRHRVGGAGLVLRRMGHAGVLRTGAVAGRRDRDSGGLGGRRPERRGGHPPRRGGPRSAHARPPGRGARHRHDRCGGRTDRGDPPRARPCLGRRGPAHHRHRGRRRRAGSRGRIPDGVGPRRRRRHVSRRIGRRRRSRRCGGARDRPRTRGTRGPGDYHPRPRAALTSLRSPVAVPLRPSGGR